MQLAPTCNHLTRVRDKLVINPLITDIFALKSSISGGCRKNINFSEVYETSYREPRLLIPKKYNPIKTDKKARDYNKRAFYDYCTDKRPSLSSRLINENQRSTESHQQSHQSRLPAQSKSTHPHETQDAVSSETQAALTSTIVRGKFHRSYDHDSDLR